jgi:hypothetical protein
MQTIAKITSADYPDLLAAVNAGVPQRELARRYDCARSLIARHVARAIRAQEHSERPRGPDLDMAAMQREGSTREILQALIRNPKTSARDVASLTNALARVNEEEPKSGPSIKELRLGTLIIEPEPRSGPKPRYRMMLRVPGGVEYLAGTGYEFSPADVLWVVLFFLRTELGLPCEDMLKAATPEQ